LLGLEVSICSRALGPKLQLSLLHTLRNNP